MTVWRAIVDRPLSRFAFGFDLHVRLTKNDEYYQYIRVVWTDETAGAIQRSRAVDTRLAGIALSAIRAWQEGGQPHQPPQATEALELRPEVDPQSRAIAEFNNEEESVLGEWSDWIASELRAQVMKDLVAADEEGAELATAFLDSLERAQITEVEAQRVKRWLADERFVDGLFRKQADGEFYLFEIDRLTEAGRTWARANSTAPNPSPDGPRVVPQRSPDHDLMEAAVEEMRLSKTSPKVGAVIANREGEILARGHRTGNGTHAEQNALRQLPDTVEGPLTLYSTLEPCTSTTSDCCAAIIQAEVLSTVVIGRYDLHPDINRAGWTALKNAGIELRDFDADLRARCDDINSNTYLQHQRRTGPSDHGRFSYKSNDASGVLKVRFSDNDPRSIDLRFTDRDDTSVYAVAAHGIRVARVAGATQLNDVDDPRALTNYSHTAAVNQGELAAFCSDEGAVIVKVKKVDRTTASVNYEFEVLLFE